MFGVTLFIGALTRRSGIIRRWSYYYAAFILYIVLLYARCDNWLMRRPNQACRIDRLKALSSPKAANAEKSRNYKLESRKLQRELATAPA